MRSAVLRLVGRGAASAQVANLACDIAQPELQRGQLFEVTGSIVAGGSLAAALQQVVEVRRARGTGGGLGQGRALLLLLWLLLWLRCLSEATRLLLVCPCRLCCCRVAEQREPTASLRRLLLRRGASEQGRRGRCCRLGPPERPAKKTAPRRSTARGWRCSACLHACRPAA